MRGIIDRFEADKALIEVRGKIKIVQRGLLPSEAREGMAVVFAKGHWSIDKERTRELMQANQQLMDDLWK